MSSQGPVVFRKAVQALSNLPGIGERTAQRLVFHLMKQDAGFTQNISTSIVEMKQQMKLCSTCFGYTDQEKCVICVDTKRDHELVCVVEDPCDVFALEKSGQFRGSYHVLHGTLSPLEGVGPDQLKIKEMIGRFATIKPREVILATNPSVEGDTTALYISNLLKDRAISITRIAMGIPMGGSLEYMDQVTLARAIHDRRSIT
jgi:recombination protein RecR